MKNDKLTLSIKWIATIITLAGAALTSAAIDPLNIWLLNIGSILFIWWSFRIRDLAMITVNVGLFLIYGSGIIWRFLHS